MIDTVKGRVSSAILDKESRLLTLSLFDMFGLEAAYVMTGDIININFKQGQIVEFSINFMGFFVNCKIDGVFSGLSGRIFLFNHESQR